MQIKLTEKAWQHIRDDCLTISELPGAIADEKRFAVGVATAIKPLIDAGPDEAGWIAVERDVASWEKLRELLARHQKRLSHTSYLSLIAINQAIGRQQNKSPIKVSREEMEFARESMDRTED